MSPTFAVIIMSSLVCLQASDEFQFFSYDPKTYEDAGKRLLQGLNNKSKPCENFFDHVCGNFPWQGNESYEAAFGNEASQFSKTGIQLIKAIDINKSDTIDYHRHLKIFFDQCLEARNTTDWMKSLIAEIGKTIKVSPTTNDTELDESKPNAAAAWNFLGKVKRRFRYNLLTVLLLSNGPSVFLAPKDCAQTEILANGNRHILAQFFSNQQDAKKVLDEEAPKIKAFCKEVEKVGDKADAYTRSVYDPNNNGTWTPELPSFDFERYLSGLIPDESVRKAFLKKTKLHSLKAIEYHGQIFERYSIRTIRLAVLLSLVEQLPEFSLNASNENICFDRTSAHFAPAIAKLFLNHSKRDRASLEFGVRKFMRNIFSAFRFLLNSINWIDDENRERIHEAMDTITVDAGLPRWIDDDQEIMRRVISYDREKNFYENAFDAHAKLSDHVFYTIANDSFAPEPLNPSTSEYPALNFNANFYYQGYVFMNLGPKLHIHFPFSVSEFYSNDYPTAVNYGALGMILAHELIHMFSPDVLPQWQLAGRPLISNTSMPAYKRQQECLAEDYSRFCTLDNKHCIQGEQTLGENIPDVAGLKVAYLAYKTVAMVQHENPRVPGMLHYTNDQLFFIAHARAWCERGYKSFTYEKDPHAPNIARVEVAYRHVRPFAVAFGCAAGTKYVPSKDCNIWGDITNIDKHDLKETNLPSKK